jgi:hypothetical protein
MKSLQKLTFVATIFLIFAAIPSFAQLDGEVKFEAPFPFYAGDAKLPAGSYTITNVDNSEAYFQLRSADGTRTAFVQYMPADTVTAPAKNEITFSKYGDAEFLSLISVEGQTTQLQVLKSTAAQKIAANGAAEKQSSEAKSGN